jgi:ferrochelatase
MRDDGVRRALVFATSATASYSSCRQYREDLAAAQLDGAPELMKLRHYFDHPGFVEANAEAVRAELAEVPDARLVFTAHSIPVSMNDSAGPSGGLYLAQQRETARLVAEAVRGPGPDSDLVWQSRAGPPQVPWLGPDISEQLEQVADRGVTRVVLSPVGFVSDHLEVLYDLDVEAKEKAEELGLELRRAGAVGTHPVFVAGLRDLILERLGPGTRRAAVGRFGPSHDVCAPDCCLPGTGRPSPWETPD